MYIMKNKIITAWWIDWTLAEPSMFHVHLLS